MTTMTKLEMGLGMFKANVDRFVESVGKAPAVEGEHDRAIFIEALVQQSGIIRGTAALLLDLSEVLRKKTPADVVLARRCSKLLSSVDELRGQFDGACKTLEQTRRLFLDGLN